MLLCAIRHMFICVEASAHIYICVHNATFNICCATLAMHVLQLRLILIVCATSSHTDIFLCNSGSYSDFVHCHHTFICWEPQHLFISCAAPASICVLCSAPLAHIHIMYNSSLNSFVFRPTPAALHMPHAMQSQHVRMSWCISSTGPYL